MSKTPDGWTKVSMEDFRRGLAIISEAHKNHPDDRKAIRAAYKRANEAVGITGKKANAGNPTT